MNTTLSYFVHRRTGHGNSRNQAFWNFRVGPVVTNGGAGWVTGGGKFVSSSDVFSFLVFGSKKIENSL